MAEACGIVLQVWIVAHRVIMVELMARVRGAGRHAVVDALVADPAIGGGASLGVQALAFLEERLRARANETLSFGRITMPHNLARVVLLEQIYRAIKISRGEPYHK